MESALKRPTALCAMVPGWGEQGIRGREGCCPRLGEPCAHCPNADLEQRRKKGGRHGWMKLEIKAPWGSVRPAARALARGSCRGWRSLCRGGQPWATASSLLELGADPARGEQGREKLACALDSRGSGQWT
uniref:Uncharacterized protein n=1 Tax=Zea mays TaxID=4577 RepID=A0A804UGT5_MAIZE